MMRLLRGFLLAGLLGLMPLVAGASAAQVVPTPAPRPAYTAPSVAPTAAARTSRAPASVESGHGSVFFLRGLLNVFSRGMDRLSDKLEAKGIPSRVTNYSHWEQFAVLLVSKYRTDKSIVPVVIIGHSLGADAAVNMGNYLASRGVPVRLVVLFDAVDGASRVGAGIEEVINYYKSDGVGKIVKASSTFTGKLSNIDLADRSDIDHLNIEKAASLHDEVIAEVLGIFSKP